MLFIWLFLVCIVLYIVLKEIFYLLLFFTASSVQSVADENLSLVDIENVLLERVKDRKDDLKVAFEAFDQEGNKTVTKGEFRRVIEGFLVPLTESQFEGLLAEVCSFRITTPFSVHLLLFCGTGQWFFILNISYSHYIKYLF